MNTELSPKWEAFRTAAKVAGIGISANGDITSGKEKLDAILGMDMNSLDIPAYQKASGYQSIIEQLSSGISAGSSYTENQQAFKAIFGSTPEEMSGEDRAAVADSDNDGTIEISEVNAAFADFNDSMENSETGVLKLLNGFGYSYDPQKNAVSDAQGNALDTAKFAQLSDAYRNVRLLDIADMFVSGVSEALPVQETSEKSQATATGLADFDNDGVITAGDISIGTGKALEYAGEVKSRSQALGVTVAGFDTANGFRFSGIASAVS